MAARHPQYKDTTMTVVETTTHQDDTERHGVPDMAPRHSQFSDKRHAVPGMAARHPRHNDMTMNVVETTTRHSAATPKLLAAYGMWGLTRRRRLSVQRRNTECGQLSTR